MAETIEDDTGASSERATLLRIEASLREVLTALDALSLELAATHVQWALDIVEQRTSASQVSA